jgi:hypothetical protein
VLYSVLFLFSIIFWHVLFLSGLFWSGLALSGLVWSGFGRQDPVKLQLIGAHLRRIWPSLVWLDWFHSG